MQFTLTKGALATVNADLVFVVCLQEKPDTGTRASLQRADGGTELDKLLSGRLTRAIEHEGFEGGLGSYRLFDTNGAIRARYVALIGAGATDAFGPIAWHKLGAAINAAAQSVKAARVAGVLQQSAIRSLAAPARVQALIQGMLLGQYRCDRFRKPADRKKPVISSFTILSEKKNAGLDAAIERAVALAEATCLARELVNLPSNVCTPQYLAAEAEKIGKLGRITCKVYDAKALKAQRMHLLLTVGRGAPTEPVLIHLRYTPGTKAKRHVALIGKGVTFDTGGFDLKPSKNMLDMKGDMAGAASVLGTMRVLAALQPAVRVDAFIPATENVLDGIAYKPSDILESRAGKTIEVVNTDAEGRLILADALDFALEHKPDCMIDIATLTGGVRYALGELYTAVLGTDQRLIDQLLRASKTAAEPMWQLPLEQEYLAGFKGGLADLKNCGKSGASTITGGLFLSQFVGDTPWAHLDIAESSWNEENSLLGPKGGSGSPVRTLCEFLLSL